MANPYRGGSETRVSSGEGSKPPAMKPKVGRMRRPPDAHPDIPSGKPPGGGVGQVGNKPTPKPTPRVPANWGEQWRINPDTGEPAKPKGK